MQSRVSVFLCALIVLPLLAAATVIPRTDPASQCSTGTISCCNSVTSSKDPLAALLAGLLGIVLGVDAQVGLNCSPISVIGIGGNSCTSQVACCSGNSFNGLINLGCTPINIGL